MIMSIFIIVIHYSLNQQGTIHDKISAKMGEVLSLRRLKMV